MKKGGKRENLGKNFNGDNVNKNGEKQISEGNTGEQRREEREQ